MELQKDADEGEEITYGCAVILCRGVDGDLYIDSSLDTTPIVGDKYKVAMVKDELLGTTESMRECNALADAVFGFKLRARYAGGRGPWHFTAKTPLTPELVLAVLKSYTEKDFDRLDKEARL